MKTPVQRVFLVGIILALFIASILAFTSSRSTTQLVQAYKDVEQTLKVLDRLSSVLTVMLDIETAARGFALTGQDDFLEPRTRALANVDVDMAELQALTADDPAQRTRLVKLGESVARKVGITEDVITSRRELIPDEEKLPLLNRGKEAMDDVRDGIYAMRAEELELLAARSAEANRRAASTKRLVTLLITFMLALLFYMSITIVRELRRRQRVEDQLREASDRIHDLYNYAPCGYHSLSPEGVFLEINDTELKWLGYARDEVVGKLRFSDILTDDSLRAFEGSFARFRDEGFVNNLEFNVRTKHGTMLPVSVSAVAIRDEQGRFVRSRSTMSDNRERKLAYEKIQASERMLQAIINNAESIIFTKDLDGRLTVINRACAKALNMDPADVIGKTAFDLLPRDQAESVTALDREMFTSGQMTRREETVIMDGKTRTYIAVRFPLLDADGKVIALCGMSTEITELRMMERAIRDLNEGLRVQNARLEAANKELETFAYSASHDLRAPLRSIDGFSMVLLEDFGPRLEEEGRSHLARIRRASQRMADLIDDLTKLSRVSRAELHIEDVDLSAMAVRIVDDLALAEPDRAVDVSIRPDMHVQADPRLLAVALENLIGNAWKFTGRTKGARIEIGKVQAGQSGSIPDTVPTNATVLFVKDNGAGFDMNYVDRLFTPFQRLHAVEDFSGTGIGLATVQRIVRRHGGDAWATAEPGKGATFFFYL